MKVPRVLSFGKRSLMVREIIKRGFFLGALESLPEKLWCGIVFMHPLSLSDF